MIDASKLSSYRDGPFAPVDDELTLRDLPTLGELPDGLRGVFVRNGPNPRFPTRGRYHWFDGDGMVHAVSLGGGKAHYANRYVRTRGLEVEEKAGQALWSGILEPIDFKNPHGPVKNTANTDLVFHGGRLLALSWLALEPYEVRLPDLASVGPCDFGGTLRSGFSAHPKVDPRTGEMMFFSFSVAAPPYLRYGVVSAEGKVVHSVPVDLPGARIPHDLAITDRYTILLDLPLLWRSDKLASGKRQLCFDRETPSRFGIVPRHGDSVRWFEAPSCYVFHTINAHEEGDEIVLTACRLADPSARSDRPEGTTPRLDFMELYPYLHRFRFDLATGETREEKLDDVATEFPKMNDRYLGRRARYSYNPRIAAAPTLLFDGLVKYDLERGTQEHHAWGEGRFGGEAVFAPRPGAREEDDGWLVTFVYDAADDSTELHVLDARDVAQPPVARVRMPRRVPIGFHGTWVPAERATSPRA
jgi:carotenoid cleavage dioxygenase-like enzyme